MSKALQLTQGEQAGETVKFVDHMDKFFDALNVSNFTNGKKNRKPFQNPYRSDKDFRLTVSSSVPLLRVEQGTFKFIIIIVDRRDLLTILGRVGEECAAQGWIHQR